MTLANIIVSVYALLVAVMMLGLAGHLIIDERQYRKQRKKLERELAKIDREIEECERQIEAYTNTDRRLKTAAHNKGWKTK